MDNFACRPRQLARIHFSSCSSREAALIATCLAFSGCDSSAAPGPAREPAAVRLANETKAPTAEPEIFTAFACPPGAGEHTGTAADMVLRASELKLSAPFEYVAIREALSNERRSIGERGQACAGAADEASCRTELTKLDTPAAPPEREECRDVGCPGTVYVLTTQQGKPALWQGVADVRRLLGSVDSAREAWLLAEISEGAGLYACGDAELAAYRKVDGGYELRERLYTRRCNPVEYSERIYRVTDAGQQTLSRTVLRTDPICLSDSRVQPQPPADAAPKPRK